MEKKKEKRNLKKEKEKKRKRKEEDSGKPYSRVSALILKVSYYSFQR
jgi:hypothetical protein